MSFVIWSTDGASGGGAVHGGNVTTNARVWSDAGGAWNALGTTFFWAPWGWKFDRERMEQNAAFMANNDVDYGRLLGEVGGESWEDRPIDPRWPDYQEVVASLTDRLYDEHGIRSHWTVFGGVPFSDTADKRRSLVQFFARMAEQRREKIMMFEVANELEDGNFPSIGEARELARILASTGIPTAVSCPMGGAEGYQRSASALYGASAATCATYHFDRADGDEDWRFVKQPWDLGFLTDVPGASVNSEGKGPQSSVDETSDPQRLALYAANSYLCGAGAFTLHTGAMVRGGGQADAVRGRPANIWQVPNIEAICAAIARGRNVMPADVSGWRKVNGHWLDHPLYVDAVWTDGADHGVVRNYGAYTSSEFVTLPFGVKRYVRMTARRACVINVTNPAQPDFDLDDISLSPGAVVDLAGDIGANFAYIVRGRFV